MTRLLDADRSGASRGISILYDHAHEIPILGGPLAVLAVPPHRGLSAVRRVGLIKASTAGIRVLQRTDGTSRLRHAWADGTKPKRRPRAMSPPASTRAASGEGRARADATAKTAPSRPRAGGENVSWAFIVGIGVGFCLINGYAIAARSRVGPLADDPHLALSPDVFRRTDFTLLVGGVMTLSWISSRFDKYIVDGAVNGAAWLVKQAAVIAGLNDKYVVDGAVNGVASITQTWARPVRAPQTGRIRMYVTVLMAAIAIGLPCESLLH
jgi:hypothetical protein